MLMKAFCLAIGTIGYRDELLSEKDGTNGMMVLIGIYNALLWLGLGTG